MWRICSTFHEEEEWARLTDEQIRAVFLRLLVALGPARLMHLATISASRAQAVIDRSAMRSSVAPPPLREPGPSEES
jgi:hypothetical protein